MNPRPILSFFLTAVLAFSGTLSAAGQAVVPDGKIDFLKRDAIEGFAAELNPDKSLTVERADVFRMVDGMLQVTGRGVGYLRTVEDYRDYHLVFEYKWGEHTWAKRKDKARDGGVMVHGHGPDASYAGTWMASFQAQLLEGGTGDMAVLGSADAPTSIEVEAGLVEERPDGRKVVRWERDRPSIELNGGYIEWSGHDQEWKNVKGYRGANDVENPVGDWNRLEVICEGDGIHVVLNGELVNRGSNASPAAGKICLQSEGSEYWVRRFELWPLQEFSEKYAKDAEEKAEGKESREEAP